MAISLAEAAKLSNDVLLQGIIETILKDSPVLQNLPFVEIIGNGLTYNREKTLPTAEWHAVNADWSTSPTPDFDQLTATLAILTECRCGQLHQADPLQYPGHRGSHHRAYRQSPDA